MSDHPRNRPGHLHAVPTDDEPNATPPPNDQDAERAVLGAMLTDRHACNDVTLTLPDGAAFYQPRHELIYDALLHQYARGYPTDVIAIGDHLEHHQNLTRAGGRAYLSELILHPGAAIPASAGYYADIVDRHHKARQLDTLGTTLRALAQAPDFDTTRALATVTDRIAALTSTGTDISGMPGMTVDELLATGEEDHDWLIPGFLERGERLILTGGEGAGKSTLLRQWAIQAAAGIHPFELHQVDPVKVLVVDLENSERQNKREYRRLRAAAKDMRPTNLVIHSKLDGLDLTTAADEAWLDRMLTHHQPDLLITGPIYKLAGGNPNDEKDAKPAAMALDRLRANHGVTLLLEAHSKKGESSNPKHRPKEPFGWSGWMRWPEFGLHIDIDGNLTHWRGQRDAGRQFPSALQRGGKWPWSPVSSVADQRWVAVREAIRAAGEVPSLRALEEATGIYKNAVTQILRERAGEVQVLLHQLGLEDD